MPTPDLTGQRFGRLTVVAHAPREVRYRETFWRCRCDCGGETIAAKNNLRAGRSQSCGCLQRERAVQAKTRHGGHARAEYGSWRAMITRCGNPHTKDWPRYGGRGIRICDRWRHDFAAFLADMGPRPSARHSIERDDSDGDYEPGNCHWALPVEQGNNTSRCRYITVAGETRTMQEWARHLGLGYSMIRERLRRGVPADVALELHR